MQWTLFLELSMFVAFEARDSLRELRVLPIFPLEILFLPLEILEFSLLSKLSIFLELQELSKILHKICHIFIDNMLIRWVVSFYPLIDRLKSKGFALSLWSESISSWTLMSSRSLLSSIAVTFARKLFGNDQRIFLTIFESPHPNWTCQ